MKKTLSRVVELGGRLNSRGEYPIGRFFGFIEGDDSRRKVERFTYGWVTRTIARLNLRMIAQRTKEDVVRNSANYELERYKNKTFADIGAWD